MKKPTHCDLKIICNIWIHITWKSVIFMWIGWSIQESYWCSWKIYKRKLQFKAKQNHQPYAEHLGCHVTCPSGLVGLVTWEAKGLAWCDPGLGGRPGKDGLLGRGGPGREGRGGAEGANSPPPSHYPPHTHTPMEIVLVKHSKDGNPTSKDCHKTSVGIINISLWAFNLYYLPYVKSPFLNN